MPLIQILLGFCFFGNFCEQVVDNSWILLSDVRFHFVSLTTQSIYFLLLNHNQLAQLQRTYPSCHTPQNLLGAPASK